MNVELSYSAAQHWMFFGSRSKGNRRIFPKGRRLGATRGAAHAFIHHMLEGDACLWGDTINGNINRYVERYFEPALKKNGIQYRWRERDKLLEVGSNGGFTDFRSADNPENWEGFGYRRVFLNEAGIILANEALYTNSVLPMLIDYPDSELIAAGTPKGKTTPSGEHKFYSLYQQALRGDKGFYARRFTTRDNPFLDAAARDEFITTFPEGAPRNQEIEGLFVDSSEGEWTIIPRAWIERAFQRYRDLEGMGKLPTAITALGLDVARGGADNNVAAPIADVVVLRLRKRAGALTPDGPSVARWVTGEFENVEDIRIDVVGIGSSPYDALRATKPQTRAMNGGASSDAKDASGTLGFFNARAEWYWNVRELLEQNVIAICPDEHLAEELSAPYYSIESRGIKVEDKKRIKARLGRSPDSADAVVYGLARASISDRPTAASVLSILAAGANARR